MQSFLSLPISSMYSAIRVDESQLTELSSRARRNPIKEGCLCKISDTKGKKATEKCYKPSGVILLEDCHCHPVVSEAAQSDCPPRYDVENGFSLGYNDVSSARHYVFLSQSLDDRTEWIKVINGASMSRLHNELQALKTKFENVEKRLMSAGTEVVHLRQQHSDAQGNIASLRATLTIPSVKRSKSVGTVSSTLGGSSLLTMNEKNRLELEEHSARILQTHIRGWIIRKRWLRVVQSYVNSPHSEMMKKRNKLIWKLVASEEDYVSQLTVLRGEFQQQLMITACSLKPYLSLEQCMDVFRNCDELLLFHQLYLRALHCAVEKWPVVNLGDVFKLFTPMLAVYHQYIGNHRYSLEVLFELKLKQQFKTFLETLEKKPACKQMTLDDLLSTPLNRISVYIQEIEELRAHTPSEHVDYQPMANAISELEMIQKTVTDEVSFSEGIRQVLSVERKIEGGCQVLLDKEQSLIRKGFLMLSRVGPVGDDKQNSRKLRKASSYCFLFSKHLLISQRISKKKEELYRLHKDIGILNLAKCRVKDHNKSERPEMRYLGIIIEYENESVKQEFQFLAMGVSEKAQWMADITQCIVNEKENLILESQSKGELVELSSNFIRYSTFRAGKEQLVNSGNLQNLLNRLIRVSFMGLEFLNTFLMTFTMYTTSTVVMDYLINNYKQVIENRTKQKKVVSPEDQVKGARALTFPTNSIPQQLTSHPITFPRRSPNHIKSIHSMDQPLISVTGVFFALKHWICKHFHHFQKSVELENKLQKLLDLANKCTVLSIAEKKVVTELSSLFAMQQKGDDECTCPVIEYLYQCDIISTPDLFAALLLWEPRMLAEQLCLIENVLFCRIGNDELLRYINSSNDERPTSAPNVVCIIQHFNRMSLYWMWSVAKQPTDTDRAKVLELLIVTASECLQLCNFMSMMQIVAALEHSSVLRFTNMWAMITKNVKQQHRAIKRVSSTDGRYRSLRQATRDATPPMIPYLATTLAELVSLKEAMPSYVEGDLINFTKMRRITRTVKSVLQHQKDPYEFTLISEVAKLLLTTPIQEDQEVLYSYVDDILLVSKPVL